MCNLSRTGCWMVCRQLGLREALTRSAGQSVLLLERDMQCVLMLNAYALILQTLCSEESGNAVCFRITGSQPRANAATRGSAKIMTVD